MYTSGTTGDPKGVLLSNNSIFVLVAGVKHVLGSVNESLSEKDVYISYLHLAHIFDRIIEESIIGHGASIGFWRGGVKLLVEDIGELKPTVFCIVPRVLDKDLCQTIKLLANTEEELNRCKYALKERDFIISEQKKAENALAQQAIVLRTYLEKSLKENASLYSKIAREDKLNADNRIVDEFISGIEYWTLERKLCSALLLGMEVASVMTVWNQMQPSYAANMWNEALNKRLGNQLANPGRLTSARVVRSLTYAIKDLEAKLGPVKVIEEDEDDEVNEGNDKKQDNTNELTQDEECTELSDKKEEHLDEERHRSAATQEKMQAEFTRIDQLVLKFMSTASTSDCDSHGEIFSLTLMFI